MKQAVLISLLVVTLASFVYTTEETQIHDSERSYGLTDTGKATVAAILIGVGFLAFGGSTLLQGGGYRYRRKQSQLGGNYRNDVLNFPDNSPIIKGVSNNVFVHGDHLVASKPISTPGHIRAKRAARQTRQAGKRLWSLYLKPSGKKHSAIDNLRASFDIIPRGINAKSQKQGERLLSLQWRKSPKPSPKQFRKYAGPSNIYTRAFKRFTDDFTRKSIKGYHLPKENSGHIRTKRATPLRYNRDGTISLRCRFSPESCIDNESASRRTRREGKRLWSLYLKPSGKKHSAIDNLRASFGVIPKGINAKSQANKGERLLSLQWRKSPSPKPVQKSAIPSNIYTRAFTRFSDDVTRSKTNRRIARPRPSAPVRGSSRARGRRAPLRSAPRSAPRKPGQKWGFKRAGGGKEIFSLYLKPRQTKKSRKRKNPSKTRSDLPLICRFQPQKCGAKGKKLFGIYYKGFRNLFPYSFSS